MDGAASDGAEQSIFFQNLIGKKHFAMTLFVIGSFFPALAARDRVNKQNKQIHGLWRTVQSIKIYIRYTCLSNYGSSEASNLCNWQVEKSTKCLECASYFRE
jgi:hypothetical protein